MTKIWSRIGVALLLAAGMSIQQAGAQAFSENFNDVTTLAGQGWVGTNASVPVGPNRWRQGAAVGSGGRFDARSAPANSYALVDFSSTGNTGTISDWLMTPNRVFRNGDVVTFYTRKATPDTLPDRLEVRLSTNGASTNVGTGTGVGDYSTLLLQINPSLVTGVYPTTWTLYTITISGLPAPTSGRIGFRYFVTGSGGFGSNGDLIGLDDFAYTPYVCPVFTMTPASGALPNARAGEGYSQTISQTGALGVPNYAVTAGALPPGITLSAAGTISGTPTATGIFSFTVTVSDNSGCSWSSPYTINVGAGTPPTPFGVSATAGNASAVVSWGPLEYDPYGVMMNGFTVTAVEDPTKTCSTNGQGTTCTVNGLTNGNSYSFRVVVSSAGGNSQAATTNTVTPQGTQTITFAQPVAQRFGGLLTPQATASSNLIVTFAIDSGVCQKLMSGQIEFTGVGTCDIRASQPGDSAYVAAADVVRTVVVSKAEQVITFTSLLPANARVGGTYVVSATGGASGNAVTFAIDPASASVCSISGSNVSLDAIGNCAIRASQSGNANFEDAASAQQVVAVGQGATAVSISSGANPSLPNQLVAFTVSVTQTAVAARGSVAAVPTGTVQLMEGSTLRGTATLVNGVASITVLPGASGLHSFTAIYSGDANFPSAQSTAFAQVVLLVEAVAVPGLDSSWLLLLAALLAGVATIVRRRGATN